MNDAALDAWACAEFERDHLEEDLFDQLMGRVGSLSVQYRIKPVRTSLLDVYSGYAVPMLTESLEHYYYTGIEPDARLAQLTRDIRVNHATIRHCGIGEVLSSFLKDPIALILSAPPDEPVPDGRFVHLASYLQGERSARKLMGEWIALQVRRHKAIVGALVLPIDSPVKPSIPWDALVEGRRQRAYLWTCTKLLALSNKSQIELVQNGWRWTEAERMVDGTNRLIRHKTKLTPRFQDRDALLRALVHIRTSTSDLTAHSWDERVRYRLDPLTIPHLMKFADTSDLATITQTALGQNLPLDPGAAKHLKRQQTYYRYMNTPYPDNGDQTSRYWLLKAGDLVERDGVRYRVVGYGPAAQQEQPPTITLEKLT